MATRSAIGYASPRGYITAVYCHWNGSPEFQVPILARRYNSKPKVQALIKPGSMSVLETTETWLSDYQRDANGKADLDAPRTHLRDPQPLYHHERGDGPWNGDGASTYSCPPHQSRDLASAKEYWLACGCEHLYVLQPGYGWQHYSLG